MQRNLASQRKGMTPLGCLGIAVATLAFIAVLAALSGYFFYKNFGPALMMARDEIQPVGQEFVRNLTTGALAAAYAAMTEDCREAWPQPKFAELADRLEKFGPVREVRTDVMYSTVEEIANDEDQEFDKLPMSFDAVFDDDAIVSFHLMFRRIQAATDESDAVWQISGLDVDFHERDRDAQK